MTGDPLEQAAAVLDETEDRLDALRELNHRLHPGYEDLDYMLDD